MSVPARKKTRFVVETDEREGEDHNTYVVDETVPHVGSGPHLSYVERQYGYSKADDTIKFLTTYLNTLWRRTGDNSTNENRNRPCWKPPKP